MASSCLPVRLHNPGVKGNPQGYVGREREDFCGQPLVWHIIRPMK